MTEEYMKNFIRDSAKTFPKIDFLNMREKDAYELFRKELIYQVEKGNFEVIDYEEVVDSIREEE